jgi:hypothetical protein
MYSCYTTSTTQEALDTLMNKFPLCRLAITSTSVKSTPPPSSLATQDIPLPDAATTTTCGDGWIEDYGREGYAEEEEE